MSISAKTGLYGVVGDPIKHSLSPTIHNFWMRSAGLDAVYTAFHLESDTSVFDIEALYRAGVGGLNITLPHKSSALKAAKTVDPQCERIGAANTLVRADAGWHAHNTDADGFHMALTTALEGESLVGKRVVLIGAGGSARAVASALNTAKADITIVNRTVERAVDLAKSLAPGAQTASLGDVSALLDSSDIVVNATSMGHGDEVLSLPEGRGRLLYDLSYGAAAIGLLNAAEEAGWKTEDGLGMLVEQARAAFRLWFDIDPDPIAALALCREKLGAI